MNPDNNSENASNFEDVKSVDIIDDYNLVIKLKAPNVAILDYLTIEYCQNICFQVNLFQIMSSIRAR